MPYERFAVKGDFVRLKEVVGELPKGEVVEVDRFSALGDVLIWKYKIPPRYYEVMTTEEIEDYLGVWRQ